VLKLQSAGVKTDDIEATVHHIGKGTIK
jgi:hypothetical protein